MHEVLMANSIIELINVSKKIGKKQIIQDLSFSINEGEVFGLLGPNGAGKTTTIRLLVGLIKLSGGEILIRGKSIRSEFIEAVAQVGAIVESPQLYQFMTGQQNYSIF
jgi:ABC-2 type transport system ATP-binding protein